MTVNGTPLETTSWTDWMQVHDPLPVIAADPALRDERPSMGMTLRRVK